MDVVVEESAGIKLMTLLHILFTYNDYRKLIVIQSDSCLLLLLNFFAKFLIHF